MRDLIDSLDPPNDTAVVLVLLMGFVAGFVLLAMLTERAQERAYATMERWWTQ